MLKTPASVGSLSLPLDARASNLHRRSAGIQLQQFQNFLNPYRTAGSDYTLNSYMDWGFAIFPRNAAHTAVVEFN
jgi:hypothetical protein